jgi:FkbM family methyltransferase
MKHWENFDWGSSNDWYKECIGKEIFEQKIYEKFFSVEENDIVIDIGASIGIFTYSILDKNPSHVFCFEPSLEQFPTLIKNTLNGFVTCISKGISDIDGVKVLNDVYGYNNQPLEVHTLRFDTFIKKYNIEKIDFLKTDCEGGEYNIFNIDNLVWIKQNVKKIVGEFHLETPEQKQQFREFRDVFLRLFKKYEVYSVDGANIKWDLWNDHFIEYYKQIIIYIDNR